MPQGNVPIRQRQAHQYYGFAYESLTVSTTAIALSAASYIAGNKKAQVAHITIETNPINYTYDGVTTPTAAIGHNLVATSTIEIEGHNNIVNARFIRSGAADATIKVTYEA